MLVVGVAYQECRPNVQYVIFIGCRPLVSDQDQMRVEQV